MAGYEKYFDSPAGPLSDDLLFCDLCGSMLSLKSPKHARCAVCGFQRAAKDLLDKEIRYIITAEDIRRELHMEPLVRKDKRPTIDEGIQRAVVNESCPRCHNPQLEYYTKQLRSADEGQTVFYECPKCKHNFNLNT